MLPLILPYPPSINHYWRHYRGRMVISREGRTFRKNVCALLAAGQSGGNSRKPPSDGRIALFMDAFPPDRRRRDLDNLQKGVLDALQHAGLYHDDSQIDLLLTRRCEITPGTGSRIEVAIHQLPLHDCPLCKRLFNPENN